MSWFKENWLKAGILIAIFIAGISIVYYFVISPPKNNNQLLDTNPSTKQEVANTEIAASPIVASRNAYENIRQQLPHHFTACFSTKKLSCAEGVCEELESGTFWLLAGAPSSGTISRCDSQGCDTYDATAHPSGIFEYVSYPEIAPSSIFKRQVLDSSGNPANPQEFIDVATTFLTTITSTGYCIETI